MTKITKTLRYENKKEIIKKNEKISEGENAL